MKNVVFSFALLLVFISHSQLIPGRIERGYDALRIYNYFKAKSIFEKSLKKDASAAASGLATIYFRKDNPFHSLDSAYRYISRAKETFEVCSEKKKIRYEKLG